MRLCLFEDAHVATLDPLTQTRPVFELFSGIGSLRERFARLFAGIEQGVVVRPSIRAAFTESHPDLPVNDMNWLQAGPTLLINGRWLPPPDWNFSPDSPSQIGCVDGEVAFAYVSTIQLAMLGSFTLGACLEAWYDELPRSDAGGKLARYLWEYISGNAAQIEADFHAGSPDESDGFRPSNITVIGPSDLLRIAPSATLEPHILFDTTRGPIIVDEGAGISAFSRLEGPCYIGKNCQLQQTHIGPGTSIGSECIVGGSLSQCILLGNSHVGPQSVLSYSYLGEWVTLDAGVITAGSRKDDQEISVSVRGVNTPTGCRRAGTYFGDHVTAGIGTLLKAGSTIGSFADLLPSGGLQPRTVPAFCGVQHSRLTTGDDIEELLENAARRMHRQGSALPPALLRLYYELHEQTMRNRRVAIHEAELQRLRKAA